MLNHICTTFCTTPVKRVSIMILTKLDELNFYIILVSPSGLVFEKNS